MAETSFKAISHSPPHPSPKIIHQGISSPVIGMFSELHSSVSDTFPVSPSSSYPPMSSSEAPLKSMPRRSLVVSPSPLYSSRWWRLMGVGGGVAFLTLVSLIWRISRRTHDRALI
ncbi:hypothetical protein FKM82_017305 [Ascaphus truei]